MKIRIASIALIASQLTGCASIVNGSNQSLSIETRAGDTIVSGAKCKLSNDKGTWFLTSPGSTTVNRSFEDLSITCEKDALDPGILTVKSSTKAMAFGNIIFGGVIGAGVDVATGAAYDYPSVISVIMGSKGVLAAPPQQAASTPATAPQAAAVAPQAAASAPIVK